MVQFDVKYNVFYKCWVIKNFENANTFLVLHHDYSTQDFYKKTKIERKTKQKKMIVTSLDTLNFVLNIIKYLVLFKITGHFSCVIFHFTKALHFSVMKRRRGIPIFYIEFLYTDHV